MNSIPLKGGAALRRLCRRRQTGRLHPRVLARKSTAPSFIAWARLRMSPRPVRKTIGVTHRAPRDLCGRSRPVSSGIARSSTRGSPGARERYTLEKVEGEATQRRSARGSQEAFCHREHLGIVVDQVDRRGLHAEWFRCSTAENCRTSVAQPSDSSVAHSRLPCASTMERQTASPRPMPCGLVETKRSRLRSRSSRGMPVPWSVRPSARRARPRQARCGRTETAEAGCRPSRRRR